MHLLSRRLLVFSLAALFPFAPLCLAFTSPLSDTAVREAYFLGQRRDGSLGFFLDKYAKHLPPPQTGPYISTVQFLTPFAQAVYFSSQHSMGYSAQQAWLDHKDQQKTVEISVQIQLTQSYGAFVSEPQTSRTGTTGVGFRRYDFWKDFKIQAFDAEVARQPLRTTGQPTYLCAYRGGCRLTGAIVRLEFPAADFDSDLAIVEVTEPGGQKVSVDFSLPSLRWGGGAHGFHLSPIGHPLSLQRTPFHWSS